MTIQAISNNAANPSFTARLKNNSETTNIVKSMDSDQLKSFKSALKDLGKHHENDVFEIRETYKPGEHELDSPTQKYELVNTHNPKQKINMTPCFHNQLIPNIIDTLKNLSKKGSEEYNTMFNCTKDEEMEKEIFSMMA